MKTLIKHGANVDHLNKVICRLFVILASDKLLVHVYQSTFHVLCGDSRQVFAPKVGGYAAPKVGGYASIIHKVIVFDRVS